MTKIAELEAEVIRTNQVRTVQLTTYMHHKNNASKGSSCMANDWALYCQYKVASRAHIAACYALIDQEDPPND